MMTILYTFSALYYIVAFFLIAASAVTNRIRGGMLYDILQRSVPDKWISLALMFLINVGILYINGWNFYFWPSVLVLTLAWFLFNLPGWGKYHDIGNLPVETTRKSHLDVVYNFFLKIFERDRVADTLTMLIRGLYAVVLFLPFAYIKGSIIFGVALTMVFAVLWSLCYFVDRLYLGQRNYAEYMTGALYALFVIILTY